MVEKVGNYRVLRKLGAGGMGAVYEAEHQASGRKVAVKMLLAQLSQQGEVVARFFNEARAVSAIDHPGIVKVFDFGQLPDGTAYMVMELLSGESLADRLKRGAVIDVGPVARDLADALQAAHDKGIMHRDLKPDNVMLVPDPKQPGHELVKVLDFGIAKIAQDAELAPGMHAVKTKTGTVLGTPAYMSPEQCRGSGGVTSKTDTYSLGAVMYHLIAGRPPFLGGLGEVLVAHLLDPPKPLPQLAPSVHPTLAALVHQMLEKSPDARPNMTQVAQRLDRIGEPPPLSSHEVATLVRGTPEAATLARGAAETVLRPPPVASKRWLVLVFGGLVFGAGMAVVVVSLWRPAAPSAPAPIPAAIAPETPAPAPAPPAPRPGARKVLWLVKSDPEGADVVRLSDGVVLGKTPLVSEQEAGHGTVEVALRRAGYVEGRASLVLESDASVRVKLERKRGKSDDLQVVPLQ